MAERFISLNTADLRFMLESAWDSASADANSLLIALKAKEREAASAAELGVQSQANNGHSASAFTPGSNFATGAEIQRGWRKLIDLFRESSGYLKTCARYGLDAFSIRNIGYFPSPLPASVASPVTLDSTGSWATLVDKYSMPDITADKVIGAAVGDEAIWLWMMDGLNPVTESRGDYSSAIIGRGGSWL